MFENLAKFCGNQPASNDLIAACENALGQDLPDDYVTFLKRHNGGEGFFGDSYVAMWQVEHLVEYNDEYGVADICPELLLFASDGGGEAFGFDRRVTPWRIVQVPLIGMEYEQCWEIAGSFAAFIDRLASNDMP